MCACAHVCVYSSLFFLNKYDIIRTSATVLSLKKILCSLSQTYLHLLYIYIYLQEYAFLYHFFKLILYIFNMLL